MPQTVSVILPTFNRSRSLALAIASVLNQSMKDLELIVVDDGSSEDIAGLVGAIGDPRLNYVRRPVNGGAAAARNTGLSVASGDYIAFQDSDDLWLPDKLERQLALFATLPEGVGAVVGAKILYGRDERLRYGAGRVSQAPPPHSPLALYGDQLAHLLTGNRVSVQNSLFRKDCMPGRDWFDPRAKANEDWDFAVRLAQRTTIFEDIEPVVLAFVSDDSVSRDKRKECIGVLRVLRTNRDILRRYPRQRSKMLLDAGRCAHALGKRRTSAAFVLKSVRTYPPTAAEVVWSLGGMAFRRLRDAFAPARATTSERRTPESAGLQAKPSEVRSQTGAVRASCAS